MHNQHSIERDIITRLTRGGRSAARPVSRAWADHLITGVSTLALLGLLATCLPELLLALLGCAVVGALGQPGPQ